MAVWSFVITVIAGFMASSFFGNLLNWPDAGAIFAVATMGAIILWAIRGRDKPGGPSEDSPE